MLLDEAILEDLKLSGAGTAQDIRDRLSQGVQAALKRLVAAGKIKEENFPGWDYPKTYSLPKIQQADEIGATAPRGFAQGNTADHRPFFFIF
jgi:hypothetical protein